MGKSTDANVCFGVKLEEGQEPWGNKDVQNWWLEVSGFEPSKEVFDSEGMLASGMTRLDVDRYMKERAEFLKKHPLPFREVNYCSSEFPMFILACPSSVITAHRGFPHNLSLWKQTVKDEEITALEYFFADHMDLDSYDPKWWICSYTD